MARRGKYLPLRSTVSWKKSKATSNFGFSSRSCHIRYAANKGCLELAEEFATRLNLGNESKGPSPKRLKCNASLPGKVCLIILRRERETANVWKLANAIDKARTTQPEKTTSGRKFGNGCKKRSQQQQQQKQPPPLPTQQQQQQWEAEVQLRKRKREATIAQARARREILR